MSDDDAVRAEHAKREELAVFMGHLLEDVAENPARLAKARGALLHYLVTGEFTTTLRETDVRKAD